MLPGPFKIVLFSLLVASPLSAQVVVGELAEETSGEPVAGALVVLLDETGAQRGAVLTDPRGRFEVRAPGPGSYRLRAERIGYASTVSPVLRLAARDTARHRMVASIEATRLAGITATAGRRCVLRPDQGRATHRLWEEARKALNAAAWTQEQSRFQFTALEHERELDLGTLRVEAERSWPRSYFGDRPFSSPPAAELAAAGYVRSAGDTVVYYAPDADALLSDAFLDTHCFRVRRGGAQEGLVGLAFEPVRGQPRADIEGVLWLDQATSELRFLEYRYTWLPLAGPTDPFGGRVEFERLATGDWIIRRWRIRMPIAGVQVNWARGGEQQRVVAAIKERGGEVTRISSADGTPLNDSATAVLEGVVFDSTRGAPLAAATVYLAGTEDTAITDTAGRFHLEELAEGEYAVGFHHPRLDTLGVVLPHVNASLQRGRTATIELGVPSLARILAAGCPAGERRGGTGVLVGIVRDSLTGTVLPGAEVALSLSQARASGAEEPVVATTDRQGAYRFCSVPTAVRATVRTHALGASSAPLPVRARGDAPVQQDLTLNVGTASRILGRVLDHQTAEPLSGATVELAGSDRHGLTDEQGRFVFSDVPPGSHTLTLEHLAYGSHSVQVSVGGGRTFEIEVRLAQQALALEPITVTVRARSANPLLARFYERRERGRGYFMTREELERRSPGTLIDLLRTVPGVDVVLAGPRRYAVRMTRQPARLGSTAPGAVGCPPQVYMDGAPWGGPIDEIPVSDLGAVEVFRGASELPAEFSGSDARCGVIAVWSRRGG